MCDQLLKLGINDVQLTYKRYRVALHALISTSVVAFEFSCDLECQPTTSYLKRIVADYVSISEEACIANIHSLIAILTTESYGVTGRAARFQAQT